MKVLVTGPESSGKSTLARSLAWILDGYYVEEQARQYLHNLSRAYEADDLPRILRQQLAAEQRGLDSGASYVICDTGPEVIDIWSQVKYGIPVPGIELADVDKNYDLTLLCAPDLPWQEDRLREHPDPIARQALFQRYRDRLPRARLISGADRIGQALDALYRHGQLGAEV